MNSLSETPQNFACFPLLKGVERHPVPWETLRKMNEQNQITQKFDSSQNNH